MSFWETLFLGLIAAMIGTLLQNRSWRHQHHTQLRETERDGALEVIEEIGDSIDDRLLHQLEFVRICEERDPTEKELALYRDTLNRWMSKLSVHKARISFYFDRETSFDFERSVHSSFRTSSEHSLLRVRFGLNNLSARDKQRFKSARKELNLARRDSYQFLRELSDRVSAGQIGTTQRIENIEFGDLNYLSHTYLVKRLLGIRA